MERKNMIVLIIGKSKSAEALTNYFLQKDENIVFTTAKNTEGNFVEIPVKDVFELKEFALANEVNLTVVADNTLFNIDYATPFSEAGLTIFAPDKESAKIATSKTYGKKFIYKNKIQTPKFAFFEKALPAIDYVRTSNLPVVIKPDFHNQTEAPFIAETFIAAKRQIEKLFQNDNRKVLIEDYVFGKEASIYVISDGFNPVIIDSVTYFRDEIALKGASFIQKELEEKIYTSIILPVISNLAREELEYIGILGFDFIITPNNQIYLIEFNPFFKDMDAEFMLNGTEEDWQKLFNGAITGTLTDEIEDPFAIKKGEDYWGSFSVENEIVTANGRTISTVKTKLLEEGLEENLLREAEKSWKAQ